MPLSNAIAIRSDKHAKYWFNDGSVIVTIHRTLSDRAQEEATVLFKLHSSLLARHSTYFGRVLKGSGIDEGEPLVSDNSRISRVTVPPGLGVRVEEFVSLLEHLYHDTPLSSKSPFNQVASILRVSSPSQLDFPDLHALVRSYLEAMFPSGPLPFTHPDHLEEALALTTAYDIRSIRKGIYYSLVTTTDFETEEVEVGEQGKVNTRENNLENSQGDIVEDSKTKQSVLSPADVERCGRLMAGIVDHFTPILFTPPTTPHMACTDVFADKWMSLVIPSAISDGGVYKPLETLEFIKQLDWAAEGLCPACVQEKREEWTEEQTVVWEKVDRWLG
ncbi:hypothetical protein F5J12DRAFT_962032 [Pisolithus orientalis]|uniref:uncharacterized protein n=1 Tax=Pisolithus orientalis TaxID=936130 RepID=UPI0022256961|nr:uncharacterized protein F5J12DRAFT_962032 [Pisolithus orientalis]KAI5980533.1 hypothetical protein F5J12DRAFT_962032 [Pisolithus orientalis]